MNREMITCPFCKNEFDEQTYDERHVPCPERKPTRAVCYDCGDPAPKGLYQCAPCHARARQEARL